MYKLVKFFFVILCITLASCSNKKVVEKKDVVEKSAIELYNLGMSNFDKGKLKEAKKNFIEISQNFPYAEESSKAQYMECLINYKLKDYINADIAANEYIELYPGGTNIEDVYYLKALSYYDQIPEVRLDQQIALESLEAFEKLTLKFPDSNYIQDAEFKIDLIKDQLAAKEMYVARYYINKNTFIGAINRLQKVVQHYQTTVYIEEALFRLVEVYHGIGLENESIKYASILGNNYPHSKWYKRSLETIGQF